MLISMMAAADRHGVIGANNRLPWHLPKDMRRFRMYTTGKPVVMGRATFASMGSKPLPKRQNIVLTRQPETLTAPPGVVVVGSIDEAFAAAGVAEEVVVIGGAAVYAAALPRAERILLTVVRGEFVGDTHFPALADSWGWDPATSDLDIPADADNAWGMSFFDLWRLSSRPLRAFAWDQAGGVVTVELDGVVLDVVS